MDFEVIEQMSCMEFASCLVSDIWDLDILKKKHDKELKERSVQLAKTMEEERFNAHKEEYQLEVLKQLQEDGIKKEGVELSSASPLISDTYVVDGIELQFCDFIPDSVATDPLYEDNILVKNQFSLEYQEFNNKTGKRKFVWKEIPILVIICNPLGIGKCDEIVVFHKGNRRPLRFPNGDISEETFRKQTVFARKGINVSVKKQFESFLRNLRECPNKKFLTIPRHAGGITLPNGVTTYISSKSVIPGLEELFPAEVREHKMVAHPLPLKDMSTIYRNALPNSVEAKLATTIRIESILLPLFGAEGLHSDRGFALTYSNDSVKESVIALTKRKNYTSTVVQALTDRIPKVRNELASANDVTVPFTYSGIFDEGHKLDNAFKEVMWDINGENGVEDKTRKIITFITDRPEIIPEEYPVYYINCSDDIIHKNVPILQRLCGMLDYSTKEYMYNNPDTARQLVRDGIKVSRHIVNNFINIDITDSMLMTLATANILKRLGIVTAYDLRAIIHWFRTEATSRSTMSDTFCREFKSTVSDVILSGELKIAKQYGPPYYSDDCHTAFIRDEDKSVNMNDDTINNVIIPKISTRSVKKMNKYISEKGLLKGKHTNKRKLKVAYDAGVLEDTEVFSYSRSVLNAEAKAYVDNIIDNEFWFNDGEEPVGFVPILYNADGSRSAGYLFNPDRDDNLHEVYFGYTRSGKTFALTNRAIQKFEVESADAVIIFDQTGGFSPSEIDKHIGKELRTKYFTFWKVYENGVPIDLLDLRGCLTSKDKKERITRIYAMMSRTLGNYQEQILKNAIKRMLYDMKNNPDITIFDILHYIVQYNEDGEIVLDEAHKKLRCKLQAVLDELEDTPQSKNNWGELLKEQGKPIVVISTGADSVGKGSEIIDMMLESIYSYKQCHPYERYTVIIDEVQDLYLHEKGAVNVLLRKGGKHGVTMLLASQSFPDPKIQFGRIVGNCGRLRSYHPKADDLKRTADYFNCDKNEIDFLKQGECLDKGPFWSRYRRENVIKTLKGKTVVFELAPNSDNNDDEQPCGCSEGGK